MTSPSQDRIFGANSSLAIKAPVKVATTTDITLSGEQTIDGVSIVSGDRVLVKDQTDGTENGIYYADTSAWDRSPDFDGNRDVAQGCMVFVNQGSTNANGWFILSTSNPIVIGTSALTFQRQSITYTVRSARTASAGQTVFSTDVPYQQSSGGGMAVYVNGIRQRVVADYNETSAISFTFTYPLQLNDEVDCYIGQAVGSLEAADAGQVAVTDAADYYVGTTVEAVLQEIAGGIAADVGNASVTFTNASSSRIQRWNTALTASRTLTLSTSNAKEGAWVLAVRAAGATGNFTISVGGLATLRAPGEWAKCVYDAGTAAWILVAYGFLPSAEIAAIATDTGDADKTLTVGKSTRTQVWGATLTATRTATLSSTGAWQSARFTIVRSILSLGFFSLEVLDGSNRLIRLARGQWCIVEYTGTAWIVVGFGNLSQGLSSYVELRDDFCGSEINNATWQSLIGTDAECRQATVVPPTNTIGGIVRMTTGNDAAGTMAVNGVQLHSELNWRPSRGGMICEFIVRMDVVTDVAIFAGMTDQVTALEMPFTLAAGDILTSNTSNGMGFLFDTAADTDTWHMVGVATNVDATMQDSGQTPTATLFERFRIEVTADGKADFFRNDVHVGTQMTGAVTPTTNLTPVVAGFSRAAASVNIDVDFISLYVQR